MMNDIIEKKGPIGAWVKKADTVFTNLVRKTSDHGAFGRVDWQFFNLINEKGGTSVDEVVDFLSFFCDKPEAMRVLDRFENDDLVTAKQGIIAMTTKGKVVFEEVLKIQEQIKEKALDGVTDADYSIAIETLQRIVENLNEYLPEEAESTKITKDKGTPLTVKKENEDDLRLIREVIAKLEKAHNQKDPNAFASLFTEDAVFVNAAGVRIHGKDHIYAATKRVMESFMAKSYARYEVSEIRFIKQDVAIAEINQHPTTIDGVYLKGETEGIPTFFLVKDEESGDWKIAAGQNTLVIKY